MPSRPPIHRPVGWQQEQRARAEAERRRARASAATYSTPAWRALRAAFLAVHPMCQHPGCNERSSHVDHKRSRRRGGSDAWANLQALCRSHHSEKTASQDGGFGNPTL